MNALDWNDPLELLYWLESVDIEGWKFNPEEVVKQFKTNGYKGGLPYCPYRQRGLSLYEIPVENIKKGKHIVFMAYAILCFLVGGITEEGVQTNITNYITSLEVALARCK